MNKPKFKIEEHPGNVCMHCPKEEDAELFCKCLNSLGKKWRSGKSYASYNNWWDLKEKAVYYFNKGECDYIDMAISCNYEILEFNNFNWGEE